MSIEWDDVRIFQTAVRAGDYSTAARKLGIDRTTVGRRFARLERAAGQSLWEQAASGYRPTQAGREVLRAATVMERAMARLEAAIGRPGGGLRGPVRIAGTAGIAALLLPGLADSLAQHPQLSIEVVGARDAIAAVHQRQADLGIAIARTKPRDLAGQRVGAFEQRLYVRRGRAADRRIAWGHAMMLANPQPWARLNAPDDDSAIEVDGLGAMHAAARAGAGRAWLWRALGDSDRELRALAERPPASAAAGLWIVHRSDIAVEPMVVLMRDAAAGALQRFAGIGEGEG